MTYENILARTEGRVGVAQLNRPKALNALNRELMTELMTAIEAFDRRSRYWLYRHNRK